MRSVYVLLSCTAMALQSIHLFQSLLQKHYILFSPTHPCLYIFHSRSISNRYGSLLSAVAMGLNIPSGDTVRPTQGNEIGQPLNSYLPVPPCALHSSNVANEALIGSIGNGVRDRDEMVFSIPYK